MKKSHEVDFEILKIFSTRAGASSEMCTRPSSPSSWRAPVVITMAATARVAASQGPRSSIRANPSKAAGGRPMRRPASGIARTRRGKLGGAWASRSKGRAGTGRRE